MMLYRSTRHHQMNARFACAALRCSQRKAENCESRPLFPRRIYETMCYSSLSPRQYALGRLRAAQLVLWRQGEPAPSAPYSWHARPGLGGPLAVADCETFHSARPAAALVSARVYRRWFIREWGVVFPSEWCVAETRGGP